MTSRERWELDGIAYITECTSSMNGNGDAILITRLISVVGLDVAFGLHSKRLYTWKYDNENRCEGKTDSDGCCGCFPRGGMPWSAWDKELRSDEPVCPEYGAPA